MNDRLAGDVTRNWRRLFLVYGVPSIAMTLVGNLSNSALAVAGTWTAGFAVMGTACLVNARRDHGPELVHKLVVGRPGVLDRVVEQSGEYEFEVVTVGRLGERARDFGKVIEVGLFALALTPVVGVFAGGEIERLGHG